MVLEEYYKNDLKEWKQWLKENDWNKVDFIGELKKKIKRLKKYGENGEINSI